MCQHQQNDRRYALVIHFYGFTCVLIKLREWDCARDEIFILPRLGSCVFLMDKKEKLASFWTDAQAEGVRTIEFNLLDFSPSVRLTFNRRRIFFFIAVWESSETRRLNMIETSAVAEWAAKARDDKFPQWFLCGFRKHIKMLKSVLGEDAFIGK